MSLWLTRGDYEMSKWNSILNDNFRTNAWYLLFDYNYSFINTTSSVTIKIVSFTFNDLYDPELINYVYRYFQCLFSVRTTLKVCKLGERILEGSSTSSNGGGGGGGSGSGYMNEESILDLGRALYKLHLQLLLLLEAVAKMYITLSKSARDGKVCRVYHDRNNL